MKIHDRDLPLWKQHLHCICFTAVCLFAATYLSAFYHYHVPNNSANVALIFILAVVGISRYTSGYAYGIISSLVAIMIINYQFTYPYSAFNFTLSGYPLSILLMLTVSVITSTMTSHLALQAEVIADRERQLAEAEMEKMRANLLRAISHDLRTPLTGIIGNSSLLLENLGTSDILSPEDRKKLLDNIHRDSYDLLNMTENLLTVTRINGENFKIATSEEAVEEVIAAALQKINQRYPQAEIIVHFPEEFLLLPMDPILIEQITINLLENAIIHGKSDDPIDLLVENHPHNVSFTIRDYGKGIESAILPHLFDGMAYVPSQMGDSRKGMGIGLCICNTIVAAHGGTLIGRNHAAGAEFIFTLPKNDSAQPKPGTVV